MSDKGPSSDVIHDLHAKYETAVNKATRAAEDALRYASEALNEQSKRERKGFYAGGSIFSRYVDTALSLRRSDSHDLREGVARGTRYTASRGKGTDPRCRQSIGGRMILPWLAAPPSIATRRGSSWRR